MRRRSQAQARRGPAGAHQPALPARDGRAREHRRAGARQAGHRAPPDDIQRARRRAEEHETTPEHRREPARAAGARSAAASSCPTRWTRRSSSASTHQAAPEVQEDDAPVDPPACARRAQRGRRPATSSPGRDAAAVARTSAGASSRSSSGPVIQVETRLRVADNTGARELLCIRIMGGAGAATPGWAMSSSAPSSRPAQRDASRRARSCRRLWCGHKQHHRDDGTYIAFDENAAVIIDAKRNPRGTRIFGPVARELRERNFMKIVSLAPEVL